MDEILHAPAPTDAAYFAANCGSDVGEDGRQSIAASFLKAYRWQYIHSDAQHAQFGKVLSSLITADQGKRIESALATLV